MMKQTILGLLLLTAPATAQMVPMVRQGIIPDVAPILEKACLPVAGGQPVAAGIAAAKSLGFAVTAAHEQLATLEKDKFVLNLGPGNCLLTLTPASSAAFPHADHELSRWLPSLGRYWVGGIEADAAGLQSHKFRAGGHTVLVWEMVDEDIRQVNINIGK
jgi:hypothetical protein